MTETLEYRARQYAAELGNERLSELILDLVDEIDTLHGRVWGLEREIGNLYARHNTLKRQLDGALSAYSMAASEADKAGAELLSMHQVNACQTDLKTEEDKAAMAEIVQASIKRLRAIERHCAICGGLMFSEGDRCINCRTDL